VDDAIGFPVGQLVLAAKYGAAIRTVDRTRASGALSSSEDRKPERLDKAENYFAASRNALTNAFLAALYSLLVATGHAELMTITNRSSLNVVIDWPKMPTAS
jgi:hypothetical protein